MAVTLALLQSFGTLPVSILFWEMMARFSLYIKYGPISWASSFRILAGSRSEPQALAGSACLVLTQSRFIATVSSLIARRWVRPQTL